VQNRIDDLRSGHDPDDDDLVRDLHERRRRAALGEAPEPQPPAPVRDDETVCRSCNLVVRRRDPQGVPLLVCDDCRWD